MARTDFHLFLLIHVPKCVGSNSRRACDTVHSPRAPSLRLTTSSCRRQLLRSAWKSFFSSLGSLQPALGDIHALLFWCFCSPLLLFFDIHEICLQGAASELASVCVPRNKRSGPAHSGRTAHQLPVSKF